jgi:DNA polymerase (family 10)
MPDNYAIADQFSLLSKLMDIHGENEFKAKSYSAAAYSIEKLPEQLEHIEPSSISKLKGIGESAAKKIIEILETGKLQSLEELMMKTPEGILEMMQIKGLGPKKITTIWKEMGIENIGELLYACNENRLMLFKGFGEKTQKNVADAIEFYFKHQGHFLFSEVEEYAIKFETSIKEAFSNYIFMPCIELARHDQTIEQLTWLTNAPIALLKPQLELAGFKLEEEPDPTLLFKGSENIQLQFLHIEKEQLLVEQFKRTCSESFMDEWEKISPLKNQLYQSEEEIFKLAGIQFIPAFLREDPAIIKKHEKKPIPNLIMPSDIKAIIHSHSNWSDGQNTIEEMAMECIRLQLEYLVISDHSKIATYANGLNEERVKAQHQYIDELNKKLAPFKIYKSIECDILNDGALDYSPEFLKTFDIVIASVHSNLKMSEEKAMQRLLTAIENPYTSILGHPTGRLLLSRKGYPIDHAKIIDACAENDVAIEINAHPRRLDLDWSWVALAQEKGVLLSINPDAHAIGGYKDIYYGVKAAQKGGLTKENNLSSFSVGEFERFLVNQHSKR